MLTKALLSNDTNFYFVEITNDPREKGMTGIIIDDTNFEMNLFCSVEQAEQLAKQLQKYITKHKLKVVK